MSVIRDASRKMYDYVCEQRDMLISERDKLTIELSALRARIAELEQRRTFDAGVIDGLNVAIKIKDERIAELESAAMMFIEADNTDESDWPLSLRDAAMRFHELFQSNEQAATLTPRRDTLYKVWMHVVKFESPLSYNNSGDVCEVIIGGDDMIGLQEAAERVKQVLTSAATLTPRKCGTCTELAEKMREAAAKFLDSKILTDEEVEDGLDWSQDAPQRWAASINALPLPICGDCNPLAPSMPVDELHGVKCQCWCECDNYASRNIEGVLLCDKCADDK